MPYLTLNSCVLRFILRLLYTLELRYPSDPLNLSLRVIYVLLDIPFISSVRSSIIVLVSGHINVLPDDLYVDGNVPSL
jgi:hypothetical protein